MSIKNMLWPEIYLILMQIASQLWAIVSGGGGASYPVADDVAPFLCDNYREKFLLLWTNRYHLSRKKYFMW
jgi:hypothetical protein